MRGNEVYMVVRSGFLRPAVTLARARRRGSNEVARCRRRGAAAAAVRAKRARARGRQAGARRYARWRRQNGGGRGSARLGGGGTSDAVVRAIAEG